MKKILVIEEEAQTRDFFLKGLHEKGFIGLEAENGPAGLRQAQEHLPDLIVCGVLLPGPDGYDVLKALRQNLATAVIPFVFVTVKTARADIRKAMELGANDYLTKPCTIDELLRVIEVQLEKQSVLQKWYGDQSQPVADNGRVKNSISGSPTPVDVPSTPPFSDVFRFIEANYHRSIALSDVAQALDYSPAYLTNLVSRHTGKTVQRWIIERRMAAARSLLLETNELVEHIAAQVGYHHPVHFFRQFRKFHGTTPQAWRSANRH